jgi:hypothetical protein
MTAEHANSAGQDQGKVGQAEILRLADLVRGELLADEGDSALRLVTSVLTQPISSPLLDLLGRNVAQPTVRTAPGAFLTLLDDVAQTRTPNAWAFIGSAIYAAFAHTLLPSCMQHARRHIARAADQNAADVIGERVPGQLLIDYFEEGLSQLYDWVSDPSLWVRRALGVAIWFYVQHFPQEQGQAARLLQLLSLLYEEQEPDAVAGVGQGFEIIAKHQPEMLTYWLYEQREIGRRPHELMLRKATALLSDEVQAEFLDHKT